ncbi:MAG TPA: VOC family protein [Pirellulales bacterium]|nr:VOC family protein [Pirellulales bacterium]
MTVKSIPEGYHTITPYLVVRGAASLIEFLQRALDAVEIHRLTRPDGGLGHAEVQIGDSRIMLGEPMGDQPPVPAMLYLYVPDVDAVYRRALDAGATSIKEPADQFYGDRNAGIKDPCDNLWWIATHVEDVSQEEMARRAASAAKH